MRLAIVGSGIIGTSIGIAALRAGISDVTIFDKESSSGAHASSRNSGVLHSGIYYSADSLKAKFSIQGNEELRKLCHDYKIPILETGKLILSSDRKTEESLQNLLNRAEANCVKVRRLDKSELARFEPRAQTFETFLHVEKTAVSSPEMVIQTLGNIFEKLGGKWELNFLVRDLEELSTATRSKDRIAFDVVVNAGGAYALELAKRVGVGAGYFTTPFLGLYWAVSKETLPLSIPLYPTPHPINPFLGVHLTPTVGGKTKLGPTAIPVFGKEQYSAFEGLSIRDSMESFAALARIAFGNKHSLYAMIASEVPKFSRSIMVKEAEKLMPGIGKVGGWEALAGGVRAQLVNKEGELIQDFIVEKSGNIIHILNAVSPGWTSAVPFGKWVVDNYIMRD